LEVELHRSKKKCHQQTLKLTTAGVRFETIDVEISKNQIDITLDKLRGLTFRKRKLVRVKDNQLQRVVKHRLFE